MLKEFNSNQQYLIRECIRDGYYRLHYKLESLSQDDYRQNGHNIKSDINDLEDIMVKLKIRF